MNYLEIISMFFGAAGLWKVIELIIQLYTVKKKQAAEISHLKAQAESQIIGNWIQWSQALEKRVKELGQENTSLQEQIELQRKKINELERKVEEVIQENEGLHQQLQQLTKHPLS